MLDNSLYVLRILTEVTESLPVKAKSVSLLLVMNKGTISSYPATIGVIQLFVFCGKSFYIFKLFIFYLLFFKLLFLLEYSCFTVLC